MPGQVITVTSGKGGVGKTTAAGNIAVALAQLGKHVLCLDMDIGLRNLDLILGLENRVVYDLVDVVEGRVRWRQAVVRDKRLKELYLLPSAQWREKSAVSGKQVEKLCEDIAQEFDFVLIDSPAGIEEGFKNAIAPADEILIVVTPEVSSIRDADRVIGILEQTGMPEPKLIINRLRVPMVKRGDMLSLSDIIELLKIDLLGIVPEDPDVISNTNVGIPVALSKHSEAGSAFIRIARRLLGEQVPLAPLVSSDWRGRLSKLIGNSL